MPEKHCQLDHLLQLKCRVAERCFIGSFEAWIPGLGECGRFGRCSVLVQVCCNLAAMTHPLFNKQPVPYALSPKVSNPRSMEAALEAAMDMLSKVWTSCMCPSQLLKGLMITHSPATPSPE